MTDGTLRLEGLTKRFGSRAVVSDVSLTVAPGQVTCLLGPSGCGKSTTLRLVAGIETPDAGCVLLGDRTLCDGNSMMPPEARQIGLMFQDFALFPHLTVSDNVAFGLKSRGKARKARVGEMLERVHLSGFEAAYPHELSGGEQQRVALARALAPSPSVILMDEPFSGLDNRLRDGIRDDTLGILKQEGTAVLLVTHEPDEAMRMADEIALMRDGRVVQHGAPYNIYHNPTDRDVAGFFSDINVIHGVVKNALTDTPFGAFLAPGYTDGTEVEIVIRPQHIRIDFDREGRGPNPTVEDGVPARGTVVRSRYMGRESLVEFRMDYDGSVLSATVPSVFLPKPGTALWLMIRRGRCFVFPVESSTSAK